MTRNTPRWRRALPTVAVAGRAPANRRERRRLSELILAGTAVAMLIVLAVLLLRTVAP
jgi:hypothetical protein